LAFSVEDRVNTRKEGGARTTQNVPDCRPKNGVRQERVETAAVGMGETMDFGPLNTPTKERRLRPEKTLLSDLIGP